MGSHLPCGLEDTGVEDSQIGSLNEKQLNIF